MLWPMLAVALGFCGIAVLAVLAVRVALEVRRLARQVRESSQRLTLAAENLEQAAVPLAATARTLRRDRGPGESAGA
jgi:hypothetical protein